MRQIFPEVHAVTVRDTVSFQGVWGRFDEQGLPLDPEGCGNAAGTLLDELALWGDALRGAREAPAEATADVA